jgi:hypothetical protein
MQGVCKTTVGTPWVIIVTSITSLHGTQGRADGTHLDVLSVFQIKVCCDLLVVLLLIAVIYDLSHMIWAY